MRCSTHRMTTRCTTATPREDGPHPAHVYSSLQSSQARLIADVITVWLGENCLSCSCDVFSHDPTFADTCVHLVHAMLDLIRNSLDFTHITSHRITLLNFTAHYSTSLYIILLNLTAHHFTSLHFTSHHFTPLHLTVCTALEVTAPLGDGSGFYELKYDLSISVSEGACSYAPGYLMETSGSSGYLLVTQRGCTPPSGDSVAAWVMLRYANIAPDSFVASLYPVLRDSFITSASLDLLKGVYVGFWLLPLLYASKY